MSAGGRIIGRRIGRRQRYIWSAGQQRADDVQFVRAWREKGDAVAMPVMISSLHLRHSQELR